MKPERTAEILRLVVQYGSEMMTNGVHAGRGYQDHAGIQAAQEILRKIEKELEKRVAP
ncbi:MAG: hypothetical protein V3S82_05285 [Dehalococcoidia bacterium]